VLAGSCFDSGAHLGKVSALMQSVEQRVLVLKDSPLTLASLPTQTCLDLPGLVWVVTGTRERHKSNNLLDCNRLE